MKHLVAILFAVLSLNAFSQIPDYVPTDGLVAWYPLDGNAENFSESNADGSLNGPVAAPDRFGLESSSLAFDGVDDWVSLGDLNPISEGISGHASYSFWIKTASLNSPDNQVVLIGDEINQNNGVLFQLANNYGFGAYVAGSSNWDGYCSCFPTLDEWQHVVFVQGENGTDLYLDGQHLANLLTNVANNETTSTYRIGGFAPVYASRFFEGNMDDLGIWNRALNPEEIIGLFQTNALVEGCTDSLACNFNPDATEDDGSCVLVNSQQVVTACLGSSVSLDLGINTFGDVSEESGNEPMQTNIPVRLGTKNGQLAGYVLANELGPSSWSSLVHVTQSPEFSEVGKWWMPQLEELGDTCWVSAAEYDWSQDDKVQMIRFPIFNTLEITAAYSVDAWNGSTGGLMVLAAQEQVNINATLDMKGRGFRGFTHSSRVNSQDGVQGESWAGEGVSSFDPNESGGGGGDGGPPGCADGSGGGGGSSLATGGIGYGDCGFPSNPGTPFANPTPSIVLGSAGGEGGADEDGGRPGGGGNGGGAVLILCNSIQGLGLIDVSGNNGGGACQGCFGGWGSGMGGGGGGAGGSIVTSAPINASTNLQGGGGGPNAPCGGCSTKYGGGGASGYAEEIEFNWSTQGLYIEWEDGQSGSVWQSPDFVSGDTIGYMISINDSEICQGEIMLLGISGCNDSLACNYASSDLCDNDCIYPLLDNDCEAGAVACAAGTVWDVESQMCVVATLPYLNEPGEIAELNPCYFDTNFNGLVDVTDLMNLLSVYSISCAWEE